MATDQILDTVLLLALPASGKSEVRRYLAHLPVAEARRDFHMGETVQLDDFPYVHVMRRADDELERAGAPRVFFQSGDQPFLDGRDWGTLTHLINEDYADLVARRVAKPESAAAHLFGRIDAAGAKVGLPRRLATAGASVRAALEAECKTLLDEKHAAYRPLEGRTLVIEFARGGPQGMPLPLAAPHGYRYSLAQLDAAILERAVILYVWVTPEESRRKNTARTDPNDPGSILHHGVPMAVMLGEYGVDDMDWLEQQSGAGTVTVEAHGKKYKIPVGRFDNRVDRTSFLRAPREEWQPADVRAIHEGLRGALDSIAHRRREAGA